MADALTPMQNIALGVASGTIEVVILQPMLFFKNASQQRLPLSLNPAVVYRGLTMSVVNMAVLTGLQFPLSAGAAAVLRGSEDRPLARGERIASGLIGGALSGFACAPMELVMIQQQRFGGSLLSVPAAIVSQHGVAGLWRGLLTSCSREGIFAAGYLGMGPVFGDVLSQDYGVDTRVAKIGGAVAGGVVASTLSHPFDTVKTCMQGDVGRKQYTTATRTAQALLREAGPARFFRGWGWRTLRMICAVFILGECRAQLCPLMFGEAPRPAAEKGVAEE